MAEGSAGMKRRIAIAIVMAVALAVPAVSLGLKDRDGGAAAKAKRAGLGQVVARDSAKDNPASAVARVTLNDFRTVSYKIQGRPKDVKVDWGVTSRCVKGPLIDYWPGPGQFKTQTRKAGFKGRIPVPLADPDFCTFSVAANTDTVGLGKGVRVKLYKK
jgi:hypothetical protein